MLINHTLEKLHSLRLAGMAGALSDQLEAPDRYGDLEFTRPRKTSGRTPPMRADNSHHVVAAARRRAVATHKRAVAALRRMDNAGAPISFDSLAKQARVSRSWLYNQPDLRAEIERLRARPRPLLPGRRTPERQRATDASLLRRLESATERIRRLEHDNKQLRLALAQALGEHRLAEVQRRDRDTPTKKSGAIIGPC